MLIRMLAFPPLAFGFGARSAQRSRVLALGALLLAGCGANRNHGQREQAWREQEDAALAVGTMLPPPSDLQNVGGTPNCIRSCAADPTPAPANCAVAEEGIEFLSPAIWNFEEEGRLIYEYDDGSVPLQFTINAAGTRTPIPNPANETVKMTRCVGQPSTSVYHISGGPFLAWGGGLGTSIKDWWQGIDKSPDCTGPGTPSPCESIPRSTGLHGRTVDLSQWDGISLWARRGPDSQDGFRVTAGDKWTDDDLNIDQNKGVVNDDGIDTEQTYCRRFTRCDCPSNRPCSFVPNIGKYYCYDPRYESPVTTDDNLCGTDACNKDYAAGGRDLAFYGRACTPYQLQSGKNMAYCFNPGVDPNPPEGYEICGDHFQTPVRLSTEWQFFMIPFKGMRQQGYGRESPGLETDQISIVRLTFDGGWIDYYIDDVRFYRVKR
jgi:hypothetical protein